MNSYVLGIVIVLVAMVLILTVCLIRERLITRRLAAKTPAATDGNIITAAEGGLTDLRGRVVTLESRVEAIDLLLVGLLKTLMKSQSPSDAGGSAVRSISNHLQELEYELEAMRNRNFTLEEIAIAERQREKIAPTEAGVSPEEYKIGNLLRRLATL